MTTDIPLRVLIVVYDIPQTPAVIKAPTVSSSLRSRHWSFTVM